MLCDGWSVIGRGWRVCVVELPCINVGERCQRDRDCRPEQRGYLSYTDFSFNKCHRTMYLQPIIPPKRFDIFSP